MCKHANELLNRIALQLDRSNCSELYEGRSYLKEECLASSVAMKVHLRCH